MTTCATTAIGSGVPILLVPAMHLSMYDHRILQKNIKVCKDHGILFLDPIVSGSKAKLAGVFEIVETVIRSIGKKDLIHKRILIIGGGTAEPVDDIRILTNRSSGKTAVALCVNAFERGADVELWYGSAVEPVPSFIPVKLFETVKDLFALLQDKNIRRFDGIIVCAAIANYIPRKKKGKISSGKEKISIDCVPAPVVLERLRLKAANANIIAFKAEEKKSTVKRKTQDMVRKYRLNGAVGNTIQGFGGESNEILLFKKGQNVVWKKGNKEELASSILDLLL